MHSESLQTFQNDLSGPAWAAMPATRSPRRTAGVRAPKMAWADHTPWGLGSRPADPCRIFAFAGRMDCAVASAQITPSPGVGTGLVASW